MTTGCIGSIILSARDEIDRLFATPRGKKPRKVPARDMLVKAYGLKEALIRAQNEIKKRIDVSKGIPVLDNLDDRDIGLRRIADAILYLQLDIAIRTTNAVCKILSSDTLSHENMNWLNSARCVYHYMSCSMDWIYMQYRNGFDYGNSENIRDLDRFCTRALNVVNIILAENCPSRDVDSVDIVSTITLLYNTFFHNRELDAALLYGLFIMLYLETPVILSAILTLIHYTTLVYSSELSKETR